MKCEIFCVYWLFALAHGQWRRNDTRKRINEEAREPTWHWIELPLDHFNVLDNRTYRARYLTNDQFYEKGGPIIVYVGGEWEIENYGVMGGAVFQLARQHNGYLFYPEHRYFGKSLPYAKPVSTENLRFLTPDHSMADLVYSISHLKETIDGLQHSQVVLVGGSYAAQLATWARLKYPHIISVAYCCGNAIKSLANDKYYFDVIYQVYNKTSPECLKIIISGIREAKKLQKSTKGMAKLEALFPNLIYHNPGVHDFAERIHLSFNPQVWPVYKTLQVCQFLETNTTGSSLERLSQVEARFTDDSPYQATDREWYYLQCTFLGGIQTSNRNNFGNMYNYEVDLKKFCTNLFGPEFDKNFFERHADRTTKLFGDNTPDVTKVLSVQGTHDPWRFDSIVDELNSETPVVYIEEATHCLELGEEQDDETPQVVQSKIEVLELLSKWIR